MKIIKYIGAIFFILISVGQIMPTYLILSGLLQGQGEEDGVYFVGKLVGHIVVAILLMALGLKLFKSANNQESPNDANI